MNGNLIPVLVGGVLVCVGAVLIGVQDGPGRLCKSWLRSEAAIPGCILIGTGLVIALVGFLLSNQSACGEVTKVVVRRPNVGWRISLNRASACD
jgi:hypothetical protein